jgi:hypothetical protein
MRWRKTIILVLTTLSWLCRVHAFPSFDPFTNATSYGGTAYANQSPLCHQVNALAETWAAWNGGTNTAAVICTNISLNYGGFPVGFPTTPANAVYLPGQADHAGGISGLSAALTFSKPIGTDIDNLATNRIYASFLLAVTNLGNLNSASPIYFGGFATNTGDQTVALPASAMKIYLRGNSATAGQSTTWSIGVANNSGSGSVAWDGGGHTSDDALFVVVCYAFGINGNPDVASLWVNPDSSMMMVPGPPAATASTNIIAATNKISAAADFFLLARSGATLWGGALFGSLRIGTNWSYVTGGQEIPLLSITAAAGNVVFSGVRGTPGATNFLLSSTNPALPLNSWSAMTTNVFDSNGHFGLTNPASAATPQKFFALKALAMPNASDNALWIPSCGAWLGAEVTNGVDGITWTQANSDHEAMIGRQLDILREYHTPGSWTALTSAELAYINAGRKVFVSFKPNSQWSNAVGVANGGSASVDSQLTSLAKSVAGISPKKMMICVWHEPENDVGNAGTTNQYVLMWHNVRNIFDANGATNVIWFWVIENYAPLQYLLPGLWPGNTYVDWVGWDVYQESSSENYVSAQTTAYNYMLTNSDAANNYASKPWAWTEWGVGINGYVPTATDQSNTFNAVNTALNSGLFPRIRYIAYFDDDSAPNAGSAILPGAWGAYSNLANSPYLTQQCNP